MKLLLLGSILLVAMVACAAPDPTVPVPTATPMQAASQAISGADVASDRTQEDKDIASRTQADMIELSPSVKDSSIHADVGDLVIVLVRVPSHSGCKDLKVNDPIGNAAIELASKDIQDEVSQFYGVQFQGAFFATTAGDYVVELDPESKNLNCSSRGSPASVEVQWTVQPN